VPDPVCQLSEILATACSEMGAEGSSVAPALKRPRKVEQGDYSTNAAMLLAPVLGEDPRAIAQRLGATLEQRLDASVERVEVAGPGFLNLYMSDRWCREALATVIAGGQRYGAGHPAPAERIDVEFVSANPTGPITVAAGRHAAYGDALCRILAFAGHAVEREYYVNDHGGQIERFVDSIHARARGEAPPEDGYRGDYVTALAQGIDGAAELDRDELARRGVEVMLAGIRATLERFRVHMDRFVGERASHEGGAVGAALARLEERGHVYRQDGALWLRSSALGDDKDRVLVRSNGETTYFGADIAYHEDKRERGYDRIVDVLGADHHGYVARMLAAWQALGGPEGGFELVIMQLVNLLEGGRVKQMSKREGTLVTLDALIDDIGVDATRWFLLQRSHETTLDLDLELARSQSQDNPVYYAQYAHARIASILRRAGEQRVAAALAVDLAAREEDQHPSARALIKRLLELPAEVDEAAARRAPHRMTTYVTEVAQAFSAFYRDCKVVGAAEEGGDEDVRIALCEATRRVIATGLDLLGVEAPEEM